MTTKKVSQRKKRKDNDRVEPIIRLGKSTIDINIKRFLAVQCPDGSTINIADKLKEVLISFVFNIPYNWTDNTNLVVSEDVKRIKLCISLLHNELLLKWFKTYLENTINATGILKHIIHYQLFQSLSNIRIDIDQYRDSGNIRDNLNTRDILNEKDILSEKDNINVAKDKKSKVAVPCNEKNTDKIEEVEEVAEGCLTPTALYNLHHNI